MQELIGKIKSWPKISPLSYRLLIYILIFSSCITVLITIYQLFLDYRRDVFFIEQRMFQIEDSHVNGLISSLWDINDKHTQTLINGILTLPDISYVEILNPDNSLLVSAGKLPVGHVIDRNYALSHKDKWERTVSLGSLHVVANLDGVYQRLRERLLIILGSQAIKTFLVSIFILVIFQLLITRHLVHLARYARNIKATKLSMPLILDRKSFSNRACDELDQVVHALNQMHSNTVSSNEKLNDLNVRLEDKVRERTGELLFEIKAREKTEKELQKLAAVVKHSNELVNLSTPEGRIIFLNNAGRKMLGIEHQNIEHLNMIDVISEHYVDLFESEILPVLKRGDFWEGDLQYRNLQTGILVDVHAMIFAIISPETEEPEFLANISLDITERKKTEEKIKATLKEKEVLLREVHHRVKNNLQVASSLLGLQAYSMEGTVDPATLALFRESAIRIKSMALIHERLQYSEDLAQVDFQHYIQQLSKELFGSYNTNANAIDIDVQVEDVKLDISQAIPCGLIVNELLSNALKYAFPKGRKGQIRIILKNIQGQTFELKVGDDGIGLPEELDVVKTETLGLTIVNSLVEQLDGEMSIDNVGGTCFQIRFSG